MEECSREKVIAFRTEPCSSAWRGCNHQDDGSQLAVFSEPSFIVWSVSIDARPPRPPFLFFSCANNCVQREIPEQAGGQGRRMKSRKDNNRQWFLRVVFCWSGWCEQRFMGLLAQSWTVCHLALLNNHIAHKVCLKHVRREILSFQRREWIIWRTAGIELDPGLIKHRW